MTSPLNPLTAAWFEDRFNVPTPVQEETWETAAQGKHLLAVAPTGSGKTLAAFLVALDRLLGRQEDRAGLKVLYISPLKALGTDIRENLGSPLRELKERYSRAGIPTAEVRIGIRNGDTTQSERRKQLAKPPEILITTPESLGILLLSEGGREILSTVETCIIDEIHAIAPNRRGTLLSCHLERLADLAGEYQRIGLTATVNPLERAAAYLGGYRQGEDGSPIARDVEILAPPAIKKIDLQIETLPSPPESETPDPDGFWRDIAGRIRTGLEEKNSTLAFIDSRKWSEKIARLINEGSDETLAWAHHGSLSRDMRRLVESRLKDGDLKTVVATGSLELGIDIGPLDEVLLMGSPASPSQALQRAGRAGHRPLETSRARIFPIHPPDMLAATVLASMAREGRIEKLLIPENPLDILAQLIIALCTERSRPEEEIWNLVRRSWCYRNLPRPSFDKVLAMLRGRFAETRIPALRPVLYMDNGNLTARPGMRMRLYSGGGAIPDLGMYGVKQPGVDGNIGVLDEKFVWESQVGMVFFLGNRRWKISSINDRDVMVLPTDEPETTEAFWRADGGSRDPEFADGVAGLLEDAERVMENESPAGESKAGALELMLGEQWKLPEEQSVQLARYLRDQRRRSGAPLPHRTHVLVEAAADPEAGEDPESRSLFIHTFRGGKVNRPLALALQAAWKKKSPVPITPTVTDDTIAFTISEKDLDTVVLLLKSLADPRQLIREVLEATPWFGGKFREAAGRALLLPSSTPRKRQPLWMTRQRSRALMEAVAGYPDFPVMAEVWRTCLDDEFDMEALDAFLAGLRDGEIRITAVKTPAPTPFASGVVRRRLSRRMTANMQDQADSRLRSNLEDREIKRLSRAGSLRPRIPARLASRLDSRRRRVESGYAPGSLEALKAWIAEREAFDEADWKETLEAAASESGRPADELEKALSGMVHSARLGPGSASWIIAAEAAGEWEQAFATAGSGGNPAAAADLTAFWLSGRGPVPVDTLLERLGLSGFASAAGEFLSTLGELEDRVTVDEISDTGIPEACDVEGLEILLRWRRRRTRNADAPLPLMKLAGFLAARQGLNSGDSGEDAVIDILSRLEGYSLPAEAWEQSVLPARLASYHPRELDALTGREELIWIGSGKGQTTWLSAAGGWRYPAPAPVKSESESDSKHSAAFPRPGDPPKDFWSIADALGGDSGEATEAIWARAWTGYLSTTDTSVLRRGIAAGFRPGGAVQPGRRIPGGIRGWAAGRPISGRWYVPSYADSPDDPMASDLLMRERVRLLAGRFGILSRPLLEREIPPWRWGALSRILGLMELGDELVGGRWFEDLPMPQFMLPEVLPLWKEGGIPGRQWCHEAIDPASICGFPGSSPLPSRRGGTWLGWDEDGQLECIFRPSGKKLEYHGGSSPGRRLTSGSLTSITRILTERTVAPGNRLVVSTINGEDPDAGGLEGLLEGAGFSPAGNGDWVCRARPVGMRD